MVLADLNLLTVEVVGQLVHKDLETARPAVRQWANIDGEPNITLPHLILVTASSNCCQRSEIMATP
jgi:hypothetical protein